MNKKLNLALLTLIIFNETLGQSADHLRPLVDEATSEYYGVTYKTLTIGLSSSPEARTLNLTWFPELISVEKLNDKYYLFYRGYAIPKDSLPRRKKHRAIVKIDKQVDSIFALTVRSLFLNAIVKTHYGDDILIITHPTYYYFYAWVLGQGIICGKAQDGMLRPKMDRLIKFHEILVKYSKAEGNTDLLRDKVLKEAKSILTEMN